MHHRALSLCIVLVLSACFGLEQVDQLRQAPAAPSPFHQELARLYLGFVDNELDKYDWDAAGYFAGKGLDAAKGKNLMPEDPAKWSIPDYAIDELRSARASVSAKLSPAYMNTQPAEAAALLFHYDCWVEEQEEAWETAAIEACKQQVLRRLSEMDPPVAMGGPLSTSYLLSFPKGKAELEGMARDELGLIARTLAELPGGYELIINGHEGQPGTKALSAKRANYLRRVLSRRGVPEARMRYHPDGDTPLPEDPGASQRVELFIE